MGQSVYNMGLMDARMSPGSNFFDMRNNAQRRQSLLEDNNRTQLAQNAALRNSLPQPRTFTQGGGTSGGATYSPPSSNSYSAPSYQSPSYSNTYTPPSYANLQTNPSGSTIDGTVRNNLNTGSSQSTPPPSGNGGTTGTSTGTSNTGSNSTTGSSTTPSTPSLNTTFGNDNGALGNVFTQLGDLQERQANRDQVRFNQDLNTQSRVYQDFDNVAAGRTAGINTAARQQGYELSSQLSAQGSKQAIAEDTNRGQVQANTTNSIRNSDMQRALSILPMRR